MRLVALFLAVLAPTAVEASVAGPLALDPVGPVREQNGSNTQWEALAMQELLGLLNGDAAAEETIELGALTGGSWSGGTARRIDPAALALAQPHNVAVTLSLLQASDGALGFYTESGDPSSGGVIFEDLSGTQLQGYVKLGSVQDSLYFTLLEETAPGAGTFDVMLASEIDVDDFLMYAVEDNRYLFMAIDADPTTATALDLAFQVEIGTDNSNRLATADAAAVPIPPAMGALVGLAALLVLRRRA